MNDHGPPVAGSPLRPYQQHATQTLTEQLRSPGSRACLVAPPGSGKTRCGIHVASNLGCPIHVLAPTRALVEQWSQRLAKQLIPLNAAAPTVTIQTYAGMGGFDPSALLILDEAHHLVAAWGRYIAEKAGPGNRILGLTATPPFGNRGWGRFIELVGKVPVEIETPPLVREAHLSPYLDLVWPVIAEPHETPDLARMVDTLRAQTRRLGDRLDLWIASRLREDLFTLTEARFADNDGLLVALCRHRRRAGLPLPLDLPRDPDFNHPPTLHDTALVLWAFAGAHPDDAPAIRAALQAAGFNPTAQGALISKDIALASLCAAQARIQGLKDVLKHEARVRTDWLRALIITERDVEGDRISARQVLKALVADEETDALDPILLTGTALWVDDDLWPRIAHHFPELPWLPKGDHHELDVSRWPVEERIALITRLIKEGLTRCLVGTRHLLGEGWDCPPINCVIDLTGVAQSVTVNQIRGRAMRVSDQEPGKVATLWDIVTLVPGVPGGERMLEKLIARHEHTLGLDPKGDIRAGIRRIDAAFTAPTAAICAEVLAIQHRMVERLASLAEVRQAWAVGEAYVDRRIWRVEPLPSPVSRALLGEGDVHTAIKDLTPAGPGARLSRGGRRRAIGWITASSAAAMGLAALALATPPVGWLLAGVAAVVASAAPVVAWRQDQRDLSIEAAAMEALHRALVNSGQIAGPLCRSGASAWVDDTPEASRRFAEAAAELLSPLRYPRYILAEPRGWVWPVPAALGADRLLANHFAAAWAEVVGSCEVIFARQGRGRELLVAAWRQADRRGGVEIIEGWE